MTVVEKFEKGYVGRKKLPKGEICIRENMIVVHTHACHNHDSTKHSLHI